MEKICPICGKPLNDDTTVCSHFGTSVVATPTNDAPASAPKKRMSQKTKIVIGVTAGVLALILILVVIFSGPLSPEAVAYNYAALMNGEVIRTIKLAPAEYWQYKAENDSLSMFELIHMAQESIGEKADARREKYGTYKVTSEVYKQEDMDENMLSQVAEGLTKYGIKKSNVKAGKFLSVKYTVQTPEGDEEIGKLLLVVQIGYAWYAIDYQPAGGYVNFVLSIESNIYAN